MRRWHVTSIGSQRTEVLAPRRRTVLFCAVALLTTSAACGSTREGSAGGASSNGVSSAGANSSSSGASGAAASGNNTSGATPSNIGGNAATPSNIATSGAAAGGNGASRAAPSGAVAGASGSRGVNTGRSNDGGSMIAGSAGKLAPPAAGAASTEGTAGRASSDAPNTTGDCELAPQPPPLIGWATDASGTTGGGDQTPVVVTSASELSANLSGTAPRVVHVKGSISGSFKLGSNKTIVGVCGARIQGHIGLNASSNVILRNLTIVGNNCSDSPSDCSSGADAVTVNGGSHHLWFDHLDISDGSDGNLDITQGSDFITVSWCRFSYSSRRSDPDAGASGHRFSNLIGASDTDERDPGHLRVTWHHNWWAENIDQRMPRTRRGQIHVFNNLFTSAGNSYCTNAGVEARLLVENNVYVGVNNPLQIASGDMRAVDNVFQNTTGSKTANGTGFMPPYPYQLDATAGLEATIRNGAGPR